MHIKAAGAKMADDGGMHSPTRFLRLFALALTTVVTLCANARTYTITGTIEALLDDGRPVVAHEPVPGFMPAMTMAFEIADPGATAGLQQGDRVRFLFNVDDTRSRASDFTVLARSAPTAPSAMRPPARPRPARLRVGDVVPAVPLIDEQGEEITPGAWPERFSIVTFIFTRCPVPEFCPAMALRYGELQEAVQTETELRGRVGLLSITLDPDFDRPEILAAYGEALGAQRDTWRFATGEPAQIESLARAFAVFTERDGVTLNHTLCTALIDPTGRVVEIWRGNHWKAAELLDVLRAGIAER